MNCAGDRLTAICSGAAQERRLAAGFAQDPLAHFDDQAALFGERNEIAGRHETAHRMHASAPAPRSRSPRSRRPSRPRRPAAGSTATISPFLIATERFLMQHAAVADLLVHFRPRRYARSEPRDLAFARNSAAPALASSEAASEPLCGNTEMPVVQPVRPPSHRSGTRSRAPRQPARPARVPATGCLPSMIRPNSSPESRATTPPRADACSRSATRISTLSPVAWPKHRR